MNLTVAYRGHSAITEVPSGLDVSLEPNLRRDRVAYDGMLKHPVRFREAIGALHDVVVSDLRYKPRDKSAYEAYKVEQNRREAGIKRVVAAQTEAATLKHSDPDLPDGYVADLEKRYGKLRKSYWSARQKYSSYLSRHDPELWRLLLPCDPVITVAPDSLFFECFSADESSYGCLTISREAFGAAERDVALGTTNVDYSWALYEHFQKLRSYRATRFAIDPAGFEVAVDQAGGYREEKIDLPQGWLRGFMQIQAAMSLPMRRVPITREGLYAIVAFLRRHRAAKSPRGVRFELERGRPVVWLCSSPEEQRFTLHGTAYDGPRDETIRVWGRDRLSVLEAQVAASSGRGGGVPAGDGIAELLVGSHG